MASSCCRLGFILIKSAILFLFFVEFGLHKKSIVLTGLRGLLCFVFLINDNCLSKFVFRNQYNICEITNRVFFSFTKYQGDFFW